jgi:hypothetical protein
LVSAPTNAGSYTVVGTINDANYQGSATNTLVIDTGIFALQTSSPVLNPLTGLYEEKVAVTNMGGPIIGLRLLVGNLPSRVSLYNVAGTNNGLPFAQFSVTMNTGDTGTFLLQFYNPYRLNFTNTVQAVAVVAVTPATNNTAGVTITQVYMDGSIPNSPRFTFGFTSVAGKSYQVLYSDDGLQTWTAASTIMASANYTIWMEMSPAANSRFFKVIALP